MSSKNTFAQVAVRFWVKISFIFNPIFRTWKNRDVTMLPDILSTEYTMLLNALNNIFTNPAIVL